MTVDFLFHRSSGGDEWWLQCGESPHLPHSCTLNWIDPCYLILSYSLTLFPVCHPQMAANGLIMSTGTISYDALAQRIRVRNYGMIGNQTFALDQLMLFNQVLYMEKLNVKLNVACSDG